MTEETQPADAGEFTVFVDAVEAANELGRHLLETMPAETVAAAFGLTAMVFAGLPVAEALREAIDVRDK